MPFSVNVNVALRAGTEIGDGSEAVSIGCGYSTARGRGDEVPPPTPFTLGVNTVKARFCPGCVNHEAGISARSWVLERTVVVIPVLFPALLPAATRTTLLA